MGLARHVTGNQIAQSDLLLTNLQSDNAVLLQLPTFWISQPQVWFEKAEPQFHIRQISTDMTMF
ncbi:hypothetical protein T4B_5669 [Trichinella pseudospiralis]|uniref:DUF7041 domain-containing protein n=1 Tax=Trichinella pseudospiralis TaxID=6337 RepID=A0A0V1JE92_TRIPS|nr:hypothetical protein T4A_12960 [Trichinella pseudospiralis]KRZ33330.1 hypothetical protein T4B_5669 [Trichinella pseudospiralis]KRZ43783.1 hypothetical protein T4C_8322 [Trichinella pseudospiralis]